LTITTEHKSKAMEIFAVPESESNIIELTAKKPVRVTAFGVIKLFSVNRKRAKSVPPKNLAADRRMVNFPIG
jgi:hypothetical protein